MNGQQGASANQTAPAYQDLLQRARAGEQTGYGKPMYQAPGLPPVSMAPEDIGVPLSDRVARDQALADQSGVVQRPDAYNDPEQSYGMDQYYLGLAKRDGNKRGEKFYQGQIKSTLDASDAQRHRLMKRYGAE